MGEQITIPDTATVAQTGSIKRQHKKQLRIFNKYNNVDVVTAKDLANHNKRHRDELKDVSSNFTEDGEQCGLLLKHFLKQSTYGHVFIDEMPSFKGKKIAKQTLATHYIPFS